MKQEFKMIISNGLLWAYIEKAKVHVFSSGNWLFSYKIPNKRALMLGTDFIDKGNAVEFNLKNGRTRQIELRKNQLIEICDFTDKIKFEPAFSNSLLFREDVNLPIPKEPIREERKNYFNRKGYPEISVEKENKQFRVTINFKEDILKNAESPAFLEWIKSKLKFKTTNKTIDNLLTSSLRSLYKLRMITIDGEIKAAGFPDFPSLFGRDFAISSLGEIYLFPDKIREELKVHLKHLGKRNDLIRGEKIGRAVHEYNYDNETMSGNYKHFPSWYANDSNALLLVTIFRLARIQNDFEIINNFSSEIQLLWDHMLSLDVDGDGFIEYNHKPGQLLLHQTWRDGGDEIRHQDDSVVLHPIAPLHDQLCMYGAMLEIFQYQWSTKNSPINIDANDLSIKLNKLKKDINKKYWMEDLGAFALALDGNKEQVKVVNSDVCLGYYFKVFEQLQARKQFEALVDPKRLLDKIGIRTVSKEHKLYSPKKYQRGGVWPWQLAVTIAGLQKYHFYEMKPLFDCLNNILLRGSIAEVYIPEQDELASLTSCVEQRWSASVPWLILMEGVFNIESYYEVFPTLGFTNYNYNLGDIKVYDVPLRKEKIRLYQRDNHKNILRENEKLNPK
ncbi:MAG: hypothetical protein EAX90_09430 [Candidatus Heimdallarchaeota archaeon]|nr:hypothetical protein [Candidatus Heimdallarchaeota archaeon]